MDHHEPAFIEHKSAFFIELAPLYWQADEEGLAYVIKTDSNTTPSLKGKVKQLDFDWDFGFQLGMGYRYAHDRWSYSLGLKHIHTNAYGSSAAGDYSQLQPLWTVPSAMDPMLIDRAQAHWRLHLGLLDGCLSRDISIGTGWAITPVIGVRSAWIRQKYHLLYLKSREDGHELSMKNKFWGLGPLLGIRSNLEISSSFSLFGECLFSMLYGQYYLHQAEWDLVDHEDQLGIHEVFHSSAYTSDMMLGIRWAYQRKGMLTKWSIEIALDQVMLFGQNQFIRFTDVHAKGAFVANQGDISLHGIHIGATFVY